MTDLVVPHPDVGALNGPVLGALLMVPLTALSSMFTRRLTQAQVREANAAALKSAAETAQLPTQQAVDGLSELVGKLQTDAVRQDGVITRQWTRVESLETTLVHLETRLKEQEADCGRKLFAQETQIRELAVAMDQQKQDRDVEIAELKRKHDADLRQHKQERDSEFADLTRKLTGITGDPVQRRSEDAADSTEHMKRGRA